MSTRPEAVEVIRLLEEAVFGEPGSLGAATPIDEVQGWDSSSMVFFLGEAIGRWQIELSADDLRDCATVGDLADRIRRKVPG